jgi:hypothetical protein
LESLIGIAIAVLIIAVRIIAAGKRQAGRDQPARPVPEALAPARQKPKPQPKPEGDFLPHWLEKESRKAPPVKKQANKWAIADAESSLVSSIAPAEPRPAAADRGSAGPKPEPKPARAGFPGNLARLPPLKQAVVWAEILGKPAGLG